MRSTIAAALLLLPLGAFAAPADEVPAEIAAWNAFCDSLKESGAEILRRWPQQREIDRAEGALFLAQQLAVSVERVLAALDPSFPLLRLGATDIEGWGFDGADAKYLGAPLVGSGTYRLHGTLGNARLIAVQAVSMGPPYEAFGSLSAEGLAADADGRFEVMLSPERPEGWQGPWLRTDAKASDLLAREYFGDWAKELPSTMILERVDAAGPAPPMTLARSEQLLGAMAATFAGRTPTWQPMVQQIRDDLRNTLTPGSNTGQGLADNFYGNGWFDLEPGQALIVELDAPDALLWSFQLGNSWWESLDYVSRTGSLNGDQAVASSDGRYRIVIAAEDPGVPNWLDTGGHSEGAILFRYQRASNNPTPTARVVSLSELRDALPADTPSVSPEQRAEEIAVRRAHAARRWAP
jgi:hypothetical protein